MAGGMAPMDVRLLAAVAGDVDGVNVAAVCRQVGVSRKTFYKWRARYRVGGLEALAPASRRPGRSPNRVPVAIEERIVEWRKRLGDDGLDAGAATIRWHLGRSGVKPLPSQATVWRGLVRRGVVTPPPEKRPKSSLRRFQADRPNECWQIDATHWTLDDAGVVEIINILDDHSRLAVASAAVRSCTTEAAWQAFCGGIDRYGLPVR